MVQVGDFSRSRRGTRRTRGCGMDVHAKPVPAGDHPLDADVTIGIDDMPQSLDIRSDSSAAAERLLVDNVYETLVTVDQDNKLRPDWRQAGRLPMTD